MKWTSVIIIHSIPPRKACSPQNNQTRQPAKSTVICLQLTIAWPSTRNLPHPTSLRLTHFLSHSPHFVLLLNYFSFSTLLLGCCLSGRGVLLFSFWLCGFSRDISLKWHKMVVLLFWMTDFLWHTWHLSAFTCEIQVNTRGVWKSKNKSTPGKDTPNSGAVCSLGRSRVEREVKQPRLQPSNFHISRSVPIISEWKTAVYQLIVCFADCGFGRRMRFPLLCFLYFPQYQNLLEGKSTEY